jgi:hypothetical protein
VLICFKLVGGVKLPGWSFSSGNPVPVPLQDKLPKKGATLVTKAASTRLPPNTIGRSPIPGVRVSGVRSSANGRSSSFTVSPSTKSFQVSFSNDVEGRDQAGDDVLARVMSSRMKPSRGASVPKRVALLQEGSTRRITIPARRSRAQDCLNR